MATKKESNVSKKSTNKTATKPVKSAVKKEEKVDNIVKKAKEKEKIDDTIKKTNKNESSGLFEKVIILVAVALVFSLLGYFIGNNHSDKLDYSTATKDLHIFIEQYNKILEEYYKDVDKDELIKGAITGMLSTLDDYSQVIDDSSNNFNITLKGSYVGLGIEVISDTNGNIVIYDVFDDTPGKRAGLEVGDIIVKMNDKDLKDVSTKDFVNDISNTENIKLNILRDDEEITVELKKEAIELKSVSSEMLENKIGYIKVDLFANNTQNQFKKALESLEQDGMESLIIDLRDNTGGHLSTVKEIISLFLDSSHIIYLTESRTDRLEFYSTGKEDKKYNIVILQNEVSASASEIMSSALSEQLGAYIIGKTSFGKGTVQQLETINDVVQYKFTTKKWLTSKGEWIDGIGVKPDLDIELNEEYYKNPTKENDSQLQAAIKYLNKK